MRIKLPTSARTKALFIIDVQPQTLCGGVMPIVPVIAGLIQATDYPLYVLATYYAGPDSGWARQGNWLLPADQAGLTAPEIVAALQVKQAEQVVLTKTTRSCFKADQAELLRDRLQAVGVTETHFVGFDVNDCVFASAYDAMDLGYFAYVIEEACHHNDGEIELVTAALKLLRHQHMTNNSSLFDCSDVDIPLPAPV